MPIIFRNFDAPGSALARIGRHAADRCHARQATRIRAEQRCTTRAKSGACASLAPPRDAAIRLDSPRHDPAAIRAERTA